MEKEQIIKELESLKPEYEALKDSYRYYDNIILLTKEQKNRKAYIGRKLTSITIKMASLLNDLDRCG